MSLALTAAALAAALAAAIAWARLDPLARSRIVYADDAEPVPTLRCPATQLAGRPDRIIRVHRPWTEHRPVEIKTAYPPQRPRRSDVAQLLAQASLVAATHGRYPRIGYIRYDHPDASRTFTIRLGPPAEALLNDWLTRLRAPRNPQ